MFIWIKKLRDMKKGDAKCIPFLFKSIYIKK